MKQEILVYYFIRGHSMTKISKLLNITRSLVSEIVNEHLKPIKKTKFLVLESKMNQL